MRFTLKEVTDKTDMVPAQAPASIAGTGDSFNVINPQYRMEEECGCECEKCQAAHMHDSSEIEITPSVLAGILKRAHVVVVEELASELEEGAETEEGQKACEACLYEYITSVNESTLEEAEYHGRKVTLGKPLLTPDGPKKRSVYVKNKKGNVVKVNFGDKKMRIKKSSPSHRQSFKARHKCSQKKDRTSPGFWSCRQWNK